MRIWIVGLGTVGQWLLRALHEHAASLERRYGFVPRIVGVANARHGFVHDADGLDPLIVLEQVSSGRRLEELAGVRHWHDVVEGLRATEADVLVEVTASRAEGGEPGFTHMREALRRGIHVVTSNKWPVALHGVELVELARGRGVSFRAESTVMSGTPVLSTLVAGLAGATPTALRGILNATSNFILTRMEEGASYEGALGEAQELALAERDPTADVEGYDAMAKAMILAGLVFGRQLRAEKVVRRGITGITRAEIDAAKSDGAQVKQLVTLELRETGAANDVVARVEPSALPRDDPLASISGVVNAIVCRAAPVGEVMVTGPGAGPELAGQGVFSDLIAVAH
ncbi:MAG: homoserine dehydrogenase [Actinomycetota bacterium]|nr:homoserine dehydrogenase [Actinomycetota bacterium]